MSDQPKCLQCGTSLSTGALAGLCPACLLQQGTASDSGIPGESEPFEPLSLERVAQLFPQFDILQLIGKGGMGSIYKARQRALDRVVALKLLPGRAGAGSGFEERFNREARALARLSHPNIVAVHEFGEVQGLHYFLMEFVDGVNLRQLQRADRLSPREALQIVPQICDALQYAHDEGIVHRDIKPENVLVDRKGRVKIADFGLAKILGGPKLADLRLTAEGQVMGTPHYMAPEQVERPLEVDHRADIYALGVVFYEMLTGELPLGKFAPPSRKVRVDVRLDEVVLHALEKEPDLRYQQASQVKNDVATISAGPARANPQPGKAGVTSSGERQVVARPYRARRARRALVAGSSAFLFIFLLTAAITFMLPESYVGVARVELRSPGAAAGELSRFDAYVVQTEVEKIKSQRVLEGALKRLNLNQLWARRYGASEPLSDGQMLMLLRKMLDVRQSPNTSLIEIRCFSEEPTEAAHLANAIAESYVASKPDRTVDVIEVAEPGSHPVRPNVPLNLFLGAFVGLLIGGVVAGFVFFAAWRRAEA